MRTQWGEGTEFANVLAELKRRGSSVMVFGDVPETAVDRVSARFLGRTPSRVRVFALWDAGLHRAERRLGAAGPGREPAVVVDAGTDGPRSAAATADGPTPPHLDVRTAEPSLDALAAGVESALADVRSRHGPFSASDLRVCVDVVDGAVGAGDLPSFFATVGDAVVEADGMAHALVPASRDADVVAALRPEFDVVVHLRKTNADVEQRWTIPEYGVETEWTGLGGR